MSWKKSCLINTIIVVVIFILLVIILATGCSAYNVWHEEVYKPTMTGARWVWEQEDDDVTRRSEMH